MRWMDEALREARMRDMGEVVISPNDIPAGCVGHSLVRLSQPRCTQADFDTSIRQLFSEAEWSKFELMRHIQVEKWCDSVGPVFYEMHFERGTPVLRVKLLGLGIAG